MKSFAGTSHSVDETMRIGRTFGEQLVAGDVVAMIGDLGAGKTHFVKGIASAHGVDPDTVSSPTFTIAHEYSGRIPVYHLDLYRLEDTSELLRSGADEYIGGNGICLIEWPEKAESLLPQSTFLVRIIHGGDDTRDISIHPAIRDV